MKLNAAEMAGFCDKSAQPKPLGNAGSDTEELDIDKRITEQDAINNEPEAKVAKRAEIIANQTSKV